MPSSRISPGGTTLTARAINTTNWPITAATNGTDVTPSATTTYYTSVYIEGDMFVTGIRFLIGGTAASALAIVALYDEGGILLANSALAGLSTSTSTGVMLSVPLTTPLLVTGPRYLYVALQLSSTATTFRAVPAQCDGGIAGGSQTGTVFGTVPSPLTISATTFTADKAPVIAPY